MAPFRKMGGGPRDPLGFWAQNMCQNVANHHSEALARNFKIPKDPSLSTDFPLFSLLQMPDNVINDFSYKCLVNSMPSGGGHFLSQNLNGIKNLVAEHLRLRKINHPPVNYIDLTKQGIKLIDTWMELYLDPKLAEHNWLVPILAVTCSFVNWAGVMADKEEAMSNEFGDEESVQDLTENRYTKEVINSIRGKLGRCRGDEEKHGAYVVLMAASMKGFIQLKNMQMAAGFLKAIDSQKINYQRVPRGPMVSFRLYLGKLYMQQESFEQAETELVWALSNTKSCHKKMRQNILECLVAVRLRLGVIPSFELLRKYELNHYCELLYAVKTGNIKQFDRAMDTYALALIKHGTILCVEKSKFIVYRTLIQHIKDWWVKHSTLCTKSNIVPIAAFTAGMKWQSDYMFDEHETACVISNLIRSGYIKGYISWEHMMVVFSGVEPFPKLKSIRSL